MSRKWTEKRVKLLLERESLCCYCANCEGQCSWSGEGIPVRGWEARQQSAVGKADADEALLCSYHVTDCPSFSPDRSARAAVIAPYLSLAGKQKMLH